METVAGCLWSCFVSLPPCVALSESPMDKRNTSIQTVVSIRQHQRNMEFVICPVTNALMRWLQGDRSYSKRKKTELVLNEHDCLAKQEGAKGW